MTAFTVDSVATHSNVPRREGRRGGDIQIVARDDLGWFCLIPMSRTLMSAVVVVPRAAMQAMYGAERVESGELLDRMIRDNLRLRGS